VTTSLVPQGRCLNRRHVAHQTGKPAPATREHCGVDNDCSDKRTFSEMAHMLLRSAVFFGFMPLGTMGSKEQHCKLQRGSAESIV